MNQFTFPDWQPWVWFAVGWVAMTITLVIALLLARVWGAAVTQVIDMVSDLIGESLRKILWIGLLFGLIGGGLMLIPKTVSQSARTMTHIWPTATPTPLPRWDTYFPLIAHE